MAHNLNQLLGTSTILWNLGDLYHSVNDPGINKDISRSRSEAADINKMFRGRIDTLTAAELNDLVKRLEKLETRLGKISTFAYLNFSTATKDPEASAFLQRIKEVLSTINKETIFFELEWSKTDDKTAEAVLVSDTIQHYRHYLLNLRKYTDHLLSHQEESLILELAPVGRSSWNNLFDKIMGHMIFGRQKKSEEEILSELYNSDRKIRRQAAKDLTRGLKSQLHVLNHIFNTLLADKMISDRLRRYESWVASMNLYNELHDSTVNVLIDTVTARYDIVRRYYRLKGKLLSLKKLKDYDRYAPLPHLPQTSIPWTEAQEMILAAFHAFSPLMAETAKLFFDRNWIHAPIVEGKRGGAFAHPCVPDVHPYVLVNYTGNIRDVSTVAHELGHGVHQYLAAEKGYFNSNTPLVLAETASVFAELLLFNSQLEKIESAEGKRAFICQKLESIFATVFRQIAMNRFEELAHNARREKGELTNESISEYWLQTQQEMFGNSVHLTGDYAVWWSYIPHFLHSPGYVYSYAFGELLVLSLYSLYKKDPEAFVPKYIELLRAGGSASPYELVGAFGLNLDDPAFWRGGLAIIDELLVKVEE